MFQNVFLMETKIKDMETKIKDMQTKIKDMQTDPLVELD